MLAYPVVTLEGPEAHSGSRRNLLGEPADAALVALLSNERQVTARTPPTFLFHTADDPGVPAKNSLLFFDALLAAGVPAELHVFGHGKHGVGLAPDDPALSAWPRLCAQWLEDPGAACSPAALTTQTGRLSFQDDDVLRRPRGREEAPWPGGPTT